MRNRQHRRKAESNSTPTQNVLSRDGIDGLPASEVGLGSGRVSHLGLPIRMSIRFGLRTQMLAVTFVAIALGMVVALYHRQSKTIADFKNRDVYIYAEYNGPVSLRRFLEGSGILVR